MQIRTGRPATMAPNAMVVSPHSLASDAGVELLKAGGNAVDAAIAVSAALSVIYPHMTGVGGDAFWLVYEAREDRVHYLDAAGRAAAGAGPGWFVDRGMDAIPLRGPLPATLTVPGAVDGWCSAHEALGRISLERCLEPAMGFATDGYPVTARLAHWIETVAAQGVLNDAAAQLFLPDGTPPPAASRLRNPDLARTLRAIGANGRAGFYAGDVARALTDYASEAGGFFTRHDLAAQRSSWGAPLRGLYRGVEIVETPPPTQGFTVLEMLNLIEGFEVAGWPHGSADLVHHLVQAKQIAFHDRDQVLADPDHMQSPVERLVSKGYADERRTLMDPERALPWDQVPSYGTLAGDTVFIAVVDRHGNAAALVHSLYGVFGSGEVAPGTGVVLQNRSAYFSLDPDHPNALAAGKRPAHTLIASMAFRDGQLWQVLGCMGADGQPQIHLQAYTALIDHGLDIQTVVEAPRWLSGRFAIGEPRDLLNVEGRFAEATLVELAARGHPLNRWPDWMELAGHCHGITIDPGSRLRIGGADPRSDGAALGY